MQYKILPFKGYQSLKALNAFNALLLGLKMLPAYLQYDYPTFFDSFKQKSPEETETLIREAVAFVHLEQTEIDALMSFAADSNGIPFGKSNINNLAPEEIFEIIVQVCIEFSKIDINLVSEEEKKRSKILA